MATDEMDAETAALINQLMLNDMDGEDVPFSAQPCEQPSHARTRDRPGPKAQEELEDGEIPNIQARTDARSIAFNLDAASGSEHGRNAPVRSVEEPSSSSAATVQSASPLTESPHDRVRNSGKTPSESVVVDGIVDPPVTASTKSKGKGREEAHVPGDVDKSADPGFVDQNGVLSTSSNKKAPVTQDQDPGYDECEFDYLFEPCDRIWDEELGRSVLHVKIPWSFCARRLGIIVEDDSSSGDRGRRRRRGWEFDSADTVEVHEILLSDSEDEAEDEKTDAGQNQNVGQTSTKAMQGSAVVVGDIRAQSINAGSEGLRERGASRLERL